MSTLPAELLEEVASYMDRRSLCAFVRASSLFWETGTRFLYRYMSVNGRQLRQMLNRGGGRPLRRGEKVACPDATTLVQRTRKRRRYQRYALALGGSLTPRFRRALGWVEELELRPPILPRVIHMVWDAAAAVPDQPLFANIRRLHIGREGRDDDFPPQIRPPPDDQVLVFDQPNVCITNSKAAMRLLDALPSRGYAITCHYGYALNFSLDSLPKDSLPTDCINLRLFSDYVRKRGHPRTVGWQLENLEKILAAAGGKTTDPSLQLCLQLEKREDGIRYPYPVETFDRKHPEEQRNRLFAGLQEGGWAPGPRSKISIGVTDPTMDMETEPPCTVCGESELGPQQLMGRQEMGDLSCRIKLRFIEPQV